VTSAPDPERQAFARELGVLIESAIDRLPDGAREVFVLRQVEGMSTEEVAATLDVSEAVIKTRLSRARATLRRDLYKHAGIAKPTLSVSCGRDAIEWSLGSSHAFCDCLNR
jgi:RNA polymerase sigma-70 factor (ECF subfamily)